MSTFPVLNRKAALLLHNACTMFRVVCQAAMGPLTHVRITGYGRDMRLASEQLTTVHIQYLVMPLHTFRGDPRGQRHPPRNNDQLFLRTTTRHPEEISE